MSPYQPMTPRGDGTVSPKKKPVAPKVSAKTKSAKPGIDIITLMERDSLFGPWFQPQESWFPWKVFLAAGFGLPIERTGNPTEALELYQQCTGRKNWPKQQAKTLAMICGMRAGKSYISALVAIYLCCLRSYTEHLSPGERGYLPVVAADRKQARVVFSYAKSYLTESNVFKALVDGDPLSERIDFLNNVSMEIMTASSKALKGYALALDTLIPTPRGFVMLSQISIGDTVFDENGLPAKVTGVYDRMPAKAYRLEFSDGSLVESDAEHQWVTWDFRSRQLFDKQSQEVIISDWANVSEERVSGCKVSSTADLVETLNSRKPSSKKGSFLRNHLIPLAKPLKLQSSSLPIDPYLLGVWIGDGLTDQGSLAANSKNGDMDFMRSEFERLGYPTKQYSEFIFGTTGFKRQLRELGILSNKNIPNMYLWGAYDQRLALLSGLLDTDGHSVRDSKNVEFVSVRYDHAVAVVFLARSLGQKPNLKYKKKTAGYSGQNFYSVRWNSTINPFRLPRKASNWRNAESCTKMRYVNSRMLVSATSIEPKPMRCLTVDSPNSMYLCTEALIPTHNTNVGGVLDEIAFFASEDSANPDYEILASVRRGTRTIPNSSLVILSSPYARRGVLWETYKNHWAIEDDPTFVWNAPTWVMNRTITREDLQDEFDRDPDKAMADYGAEFRKDVERFAPLPVIEACIDKDRTEFGPRTDTFYFGFVDPSGGSQDSMTLAIGHAEEHPSGDSTEQYVIIDAVYERRPPFGPDDVVIEFASYLKNYGITTVTGDRYAGEWPAERFAAHGIIYEQSSKVRSDLYRDMLPLLNSRRIRLPDIPRLTNEIWNLERTKAKAGRDSIGHPKGGHDDLANAVAGVAAHLASSGPVQLVW